MSGKGNREVKSMRKDWDYAGRNFWTIVQWDGTGLAHVIVFRDPENPGGDVQVTDGGRCATGQIDFSIKHTEEQAKAELNGSEDKIYAKLEAAGFVQENNTPAHHDFAEFHAHNDAVAAAGGCLDPMNMPKVGCGS